MFFDDIDWWKLSVAFQSKGCIHHQKWVEVSTAISSINVYLQWKLVTLSTMDMSILERQHTHIGMSKCALRKEGHAFRY